MQCIANEELGSDSNARWWVAFSGGENLLG